MDGARFDAFSRAVASRRSAVRSLGALALAAFGVTRASPDAAAQGCKAEGKSCHGGAECCFGVCKHRVCKCPKSRQFADCSASCAEPATGACCDPASPPVCSGAKNQACISGTCCQAVCCAPDRLCGDSCCADTEACLNGQCCPNFRSCGATCCPVGQHCVSGACVQCDFTCPSGGGGGVRLRWPR